MSMISGRALAVLFEGKPEDRMVFVWVKDADQHTFCARILEIHLDGALTAPDTVDVEAVDGVRINGVLVGWITYIDVRPFRRYAGYGVPETVINPYTR